MPVDLDNNQNIYPHQGGNASANAHPNASKAQYQNLQLPPDLAINLNLIEEEDEESDDDAFEKLDMHGSITGLVIPMQYTNPETGEITELWGSIDNDGLFDIIDGQGKTHPLMHPLALEACIEIALDWEYIDRNRAQEITQAHLKLAETLHTPQITEMMDGNQIAQVMTGYAELAMRYKVGAYGAMGMDSQGQFVDYISHVEVMDIMTEAAKDKPELMSELNSLMDYNTAIIQQMSGELQGAPAAPLPTFAESKVNTEQAAHDQTTSVKPPAQEQTSVFEKFNQSFGGPAL